MSNFKKYLNASVYEFSCFLPGIKQEIKFKPITTKQLKKLLIHENEEDPFILENSLNELISECVEWPESFSLKDLYQEDRFFLLLEIRKKSKGETFQFNLTCPKCKSQSVITIDLNKFSIKEKDDIPFEYIDYNEYISVLFDHIKVENLNNSFNKISKMKNLSDKEKMVNYGLYGLADSIVNIKTPDGIEEIDFEDKCELIDNGVDIFYDKVRTEIEERKFGVDFNYLIQCPHCEFSQREKITPDKFFF